MNFIKFFFILTIFLFFFDCLTGNNESLIGKRIKGDQKIEFNTHGREHYKITNTFLQLISEANDKLRVFTNYSIFYTIDIEPVKAENNTINLKVYLSGLYLKGDVYYRDFNIENLLVPSNMKLELILSLDDASHNLNLDLNIAGFSKKQELLHSKTTDIAFEKKTDLDISVQEILFYYDKTSLDKFKTWDNALSSYYTADKLIDEINKKMDELNPSDPDRIITDEFRFCDAESMFWEIYYFPFRNVLDLNEYDPVKVKNKFQSLHDSIIHYRQLFNHNFSQLDQIYYLEGKKQLEYNNVQKALNKFKKAVTYNPAHIPAHLSMSNAYLKSGDTDKATEIIVKALNEFYPQNNYLDSTIHYIDIIFTYFFDKADFQINNNNFTKALIFLEQADNFSKEVPIVDYKAEINRRFTIAHTGVFESFLGVIERATTIVNRNYYTMYITYAINYKQENAKYIKDADRVYDHLQNVIDNLIYKGHQNYITGVYNTAEEVYRKALELCHEYPETKCADDVSEYISLAQKAQNAKELAALKEAVEDHIQEIKYKEKEITKLVTEEILKMLSDAHLKAWAGETTKANQLLKKIKEKAFIYNLQNDTRIKNRIASLSKRIKEKECELTKRDFDGFVEKSQKLINNKKFVEAKKFLSKAEELHNKNLHCNFEIKKVEKEKKKILPSINYQKKIENVLNIYSNQTKNDYLLFINKYNEVDNYYRENNINALGIKHKPLFEFLQNSYDEDLVEYGVKYYVDQEQPNRALDLLACLKELGVSRYSISNTQKYAGKMAAKHYADIFPEKSPNKIIAELTKNDEWFRYYNRAFISNWEAQ